MFGRSDESTIEIERIKPRNKFADLFYPAYIKNEIDKLVEEEPFAHALIEEGLHPKRKILLHGPPGCGKTSIAHAIASEFGLDLLPASCDKLQSMYVGQAEKNIAKVLKKAAEQKCVLLMDEFDALASKRTEGSRFHNSVVNTLLTSIEHDSMEGFLIACTNHLEFIDPAMLRRFDLVLEIPLPSPSALQKVAENLLKGKERYNITIEECLKGGNTPALVERHTRHLLRGAIIAQEKINPRPKKVIHPQQRAYDEKQAFEYDHNGRNDAERQTRPSGNDRPRLEAFIPQLDPSWLGSDDIARYAESFSRGMDSERARIMGVFADQPQRRYSNEEIEGQRRAQRDRSRGRYRV